jgi:CarD family transcriptional regulator
VRRFQEVGFCDISFTNAAGKLTHPYIQLTPTEAFAPPDFVTVWGRSIGRTKMTKSKKNDFSPNEFVVYPAHGVGQIVNIEKQEVAGFELEMFVISFEKDKMTLRVPTNKATEVGMRSLSSPDVVAHAMKTLKGKAKVKKAMWSRRAQEYEQKINSGDLIAIAEVVRDLHRADDQREQSYSERQLYEAALERLTREIAAVGGHNEQDAAKEIDSVLVGRAA